MATPYTGKTLGSANLPVRFKGISSVPVLMMAMFQLPFLTKAGLLPRGTHTTLPPALWVFWGCRNITGYIRGMRAWDKL